MRLYLTLFRLSIADAIQYRVEAAIYFLYEMLPPAMMAFVWLTVYREQRTVAGFELGEMLMYTIGVMVLRAVVTTHCEWALDYEIRQGLLSTQLIRPFNYWGLRFCDELAWKAVRLLLTVPTLIGFLYWLSPDLGSVRLSPEQVSLLAVSVTLAYVVCFFMKLCLGFVGFWTNEIMGIVTLYEVIANVVGGVLIPIALLPDWLQTVAWLLPIQAVYGIPLAVLTGKSDGLSAWFGILLQLGWIAMLWCLAMVLWRAGLRQYESVGG